MSDHKLELLARRSVEAFDRGDWDDVRALAGAGYVYEEIGTGRRYEGIEATITALQEWKSAFPDASGEVMRVVTEGDTTVMEIVWRGTHSGPLQTPAGTVPPTGRQMEVWASMWHRWEDGRVVAERHHLDVLTMMGQLGLLPV